MRFYAVVPSAVSRARPQAAALDMIWREFGFARSASSILGELEHIGARVVI
jgi:hypothetical protein